MSSAPTVASHDAIVPRVAIYSQWSGTQELGWYRHAFDQFGIPFDLIFKERVAKGNLKADYDVILMAAQNINRAAVLAPPAAKPVPYLKSDKYKSLGMYGESPDITGGFGAAGVDAIDKFLDGGGTLITTLQAVRYPIEFGLARSVDTENPVGVNAQKPLINAEIMRPEHPVFYGYAKQDLPGEVRPGFAAVQGRRRRPGERARAVRRRRRVGAERPHGRAPTTSRGAPSRWTFRTRTTATAA